MGCISSPVWIGIVIAILAVSIILTMIVINRKWNSIKFLLFMKFDILVNDDVLEKLDDLEFDGFVIYRYTWLTLVFEQIVLKASVWLIVICLLSFFTASHVDRKFMRKEIQQFLEKQGCTLCIHERDFLVGESIPANIEAAINHSRRMIMLISRSRVSFLEVGAYFIPI